MNVQNGVWTERQLLQPNARNEFDCDFFRMKFGSDRRETEKTSAEINRLEKINKFPQ